MVEVAFPWHLIKVAIRTDAEGLSKGRVNNGNLHTLRKAKKQNTTIY